MADAAVAKSANGSSIRGGNSPSLEQTTGPGSIKEPNTSGGESMPTSPRQGHQRLVFTDPVAFRYLEEDPSTIVLDRRRKLEGYEIYLVEQWACSRVHPTFIIATYTGDPSHSILVSVLSVPTDESTWSSRLRVYFKAISQFHARKKETPIGTMMVTNLSGFPSALTVIAVPEGDVRKHREDFIVNEDLKRLGCSGRAGLNVQHPTSATIAKFHQLYRISDRIPLYSSVMELVRLCQLALTVFAKLAPEYADGLLCDVTEKAINDWWTDIGTEFFNVEPSDGILGPTTVSALLGILMGARNRLNAYGAPVGKDPFDIASLKRGIAYFQKSQKLEKTRRLDRQTLDKLTRVTAKAASGEGWIVPRAVKSTVAELSGKGGEMVMGMVGAREKAGIGEIETLDIERFAELVQGERPKWLWHGKPRKSGSGDFDHLESDDGLVFNKDDQGGYAWTGRKRDSVFDAYGIRSVRPPYESLTPQPSSQPGFDDKDQQSRKTKLKTVTGRVNDARSGFGRFKDAVGLPGMRSHHHKHSKEDAAFDSDGGELQYKQTFGSEMTLSTTKGAPPSPFLRVNEDKELGQPFQQSNEEAPPKLAPAPSIQESQPEFDIDPFDVANETPVPEPESVMNDENEPPESSEPNEPDYLGPPSRINRERYDEMVQDIQSTVQPVYSSLRKTESHDSLSKLRANQFTSHRWPRNLSFSTVEDALFTWEDIGESKETIDGFMSEEPAIKMKREKATAEEVRHIGSKVLHMERMVQTWVQSQVKQVDDLEQVTGRHQEDLKGIYFHRLEEHENFRAGAESLMAEDKTSVAAALREIETLGAKLEYELNALQSRVKEVEDGVVEFERQVLDSETRVDELVEERHEPVSWWSWLPQFMTSSSRD